jgi:tetrahydrodipicolinate N-succinyltransferase
LGQNALLNINQFDFLYKMNINIDYASLKEDCVNISKTKNKAKLNKALKLLLHIDKKDNQLFDKINENNEVIKGFLDNPIIISERKEFKAFLEAKKLKETVDTSILKKNKKNIL